MEQKNLIPNPSPETGNFAGRDQPGGERTPRVDKKGAYEQAAPQEVSQAPAQQGPVLPPPQVPSAAVVKQRPIPAPPTDNNPLVAGDEDVIEKEWVDKAKKIVAQTRNDPREQEREVSRLQADYLKKRYGKEIKLVSD